MRLRALGAIAIGGGAVIAPAATPWLVGQARGATVEQVTICHVPGPAQVGRIMNLPDSAAAAHLRHGDPIEYISNPDGSCTPICSTEFDPRSISGLELWFNADTLASTLADGAAVALWSDESGNGRSGVQSTSDFQPVLRTGQFNGHAAVDFDGGDDVLDLTGSTKVLTSISMFIVYMYDTISNPGDGARTNPFTLGGNVDVTGGYYGIETLNFFSGNSIDAADIFAGFGNDARATYPNISAAGKLNLLSAITGTTIHNTGVHVNGNPASMSFTGSDIALQVPISGPVGSSWSGIGGSRYPGDENYADVRIAEVLVYSEALTDLQRRAVECYLKGKYGPF